MIQRVPQTLARSHRVSDAPKDTLPALVRLVFSDVRVLIATGLVLTYIWRFHDLSPLLRPFRLAAIFTVSSWGLLLLSPNLSTLRPALKRPYVIAFLLWALWILVGAPLGIDPEHSMSFFLNTESKNVLFFLFLAGTLSNPKRITVLILANVFGASVAALYYIKGGMPNWGSPLPMYDVNDMALLLNMTIPFIVWAAITLEDKRIRIFFWALAMCNVVAVIGTGSRGGLLTMAAVVGYLLYRIRGVSKVATLALAVGVGVALIAAPSSYWERMSTILNPGEDYNVTSDAGRIAIWKRGLGYVGRYPIAGVGGRNFMIAEARLRSDARLQAGQSGGKAAHNSFIEVLVETGFVGFFLWLAMLGTLYLRLRALRMKLLAGDSASRQARIRAVDALVASLLAFCVGGFFLSQGYLPYLLVFLALGAGLERVVELESSNGPPPTGLSPKKTRPRRLRGPGHPTGERIRQLQMIRMPRVRP